MQLVKNIKAIQHTHKSHKTLLSLFFMALKCICCMFCISLLLLVFRCVHFFFVSSFIRIWAAQKCEYHLYACSSLNAINYTSAAVFMVPFGSFTQERKKTHQILFFCVFCVEKWKITHWTMVHRYRVYRIEIKLYWKWIKIETIDGSMISIFFLSRMRKHSKSRL